MTKTKEPKKENKNSIELKNLHASFIYKALDVPLHGDQRRSRTKFVTNLLRPQLQIIEDERQILVRKFAKLDGKGEPKINEETKAYDFDEKKLEKFNEEYLTFMKDPFIIDVLPSNKADLKNVAAILDSNVKSYGIAEGEILDEILEAFNKI